MSVVVRCDAVEARYKAEALWECLPQSGPSGVKGCPVSRGSGRRVVVGARARSVGGVLLARVCVHVRYDGARSVGWKSEEEGGLCVDADGRGLASRRRRSHGRGSNASGRDLILALA